MNKDQELIDEFVRVSEYPDVIVIFVGDITWSGHEPSMKWVPLVALSPDTPPHKVQQQAASVIQRKRYFAVCKECSQRNPVGWMSSVTLCQSCAEEQGAVF
ncbi:hypothetical protein [Roseateles koreensis]|uniref:Uncharacterized protein n=1 Tax=Roseateles koreensis TaxID=2987526 RepID=A0ABT5KWC0_9BURK|nr:hypothetical protein [Roseateles koreensis]MDC8787107.1 hypothetical protein [Roseateles koreensis]